MKINDIKNKGGLLLSTAVVAVSMMTSVPAYAGTANEAELISDVTVPETGVIQYDVTVPPESTVNYSVELTPDKETGTIDKISGVWKNTTKKSVTKTITAKVKFLSSEYTITVEYTSNHTNKKLELKDQATAVKSYEETKLHNRFMFDAGSDIDWKNVIEKQLNKLYGYIK